MAWSCRASQDLRERTRVSPSATTNPPAHLEVRPPSLSFGERLRLYVVLARPFTLLPPTVGVISGAITAFGSAGNPDPGRHVTASVILTVALGSLCAGLLNAANNILNQI